MKITGTLKQVFQSVTIGEKQFKKREFILTDNSSKYPQHISFQLTQDRCELIDAFKIGSVITVEFNLKGREWQSPQGETKYFNTLESWKIEGEAKQAPTANNNTNLSDDGLDF